ncbi:MAG: response regulator [Planctomycetes bacterium]|nr:response regulator [Planctomycetota bacterium]
MALNILIVDDSALTRKAIRRIIGMLDLEVAQIFEAEDGLKAIELMNGPDRIDFILADLNMPNMSGIEMIYEMRGNEATRSIPVAIVSTESNTARIEKLLADGITDYLHKPFKPEQVRDLLLRTVGA